jgi:hypothetical protein
MANGSFTTRNTPIDGYKDEPEYALATWQAAEQAGAECVVLMRY